MLTMQSRSGAFTIARYALQGCRLPGVADTLPLAERVRAQAMGLYSRVRQRQRFGRQVPLDAERYRSATLAGKDNDGRPLAGHRHAFYLPTDEDGDGRLDHVTILAEAGFDADEVRALEWLRSLPWNDGGRLELFRIGLGRPEDFRAPLLGAAGVWVSATPFVTPRYPKRRGRKRDRPEAYSSPGVFALHVLRQELERRTDLPHVLGIEDQPCLGTQAAGRISHPSQQRSLRPSQFQRCRSKPGDDGGRRPAGGFRITFAEPVRGPLCLGYACHFGLGLFLPSSPAPPREPTW